MNNQGAEDIAVYLSSTASLLAVLEDKYYCHPVELIEPDMYAIGGTRAYDVLRAYGWTSDIIRVVEDRINTAARLLDELAARALADAREQAALAYLSEGGGINRESR